MNKIALTIAAVASLGLAACTAEEPAETNEAVTDMNATDEAVEDVNAAVAADVALDNAAEAVENASEAVENVAEANAL
jgi:outer membrane lipoprotein-sorting protein